MAAPYTLADIINQATRSGVNTSQFDLYLEKDPLSTQGASTKHISVALLPDILTIDFTPSQAYEPLPLPNTFAFPIVEFRSGVVLNLNPLLKAIVLGNEIGRHLLVQYHQLINAALYDRRFVSISNYGDIQFTTEEQEPLTPRQLQVLGGLALSLGAALDSVWGDTTTLRYGMTQAAAMARSVDETLGYSCVRSAPVPGQDFDNLFIYKPDWTTWASCNLWSMLSSVDSPYSYEQSVDFLYSLMVLMSGMAPLYINGQEIHESSSKLRAIYPLLPYPVEHQHTEYRVTFSNTHIIKNIQSVVFGVWLSLDGAGNQDDDESD